MKGCLVLGTCILIGSSLCAAGYQNYKISRENPSIRQALLSDLASAPPESPRWVEVRGTPCPQSLFNDSGSRFLLFVDAAGKTAVYVQLADDSRLHQESSETTLRGMVSPLDRAPSFPRNGLPAGARAASLVLVENATPPGWWAIWGLSILGFIIIGGPSGSQATRRRETNS